MLSLDGFAGTELRWFRCGLVSNSHELVSADGATYVRLTEGGVFTSRAKAEVGPKQYMLRWSGLVRRRIRITDLDAGQQTGELYLGVSDRGEFGIGGRKYFFMHNFIGSLYTVTDDLGGVLFTIKDRRLRGGGFEVTLGPGARAEKETLLLIAVARFAMIMIWQEGLVLPATV